MANTQSATFLAGNLDFTTYRDELRTFLQSQPQFLDYDFAGSNLSVLIDLLAYNTYVNGSYLNMIGSEMFMDTAILRASIVSHAKELNYTPQSRVSSIAYVDVMVSGNNLASVVNIPAGTTFIGTSANGNFNFVTNESVNIGLANNYTATALPIYEGRLIPETYVANSSTRYVLQSANVDISSLSVTVTNSTSDNTTTLWNFADNLFGVQANSQVFFVQGYKDNFYEIVFGNNIIGQGLLDGNIINITYRDTLGELANGLKNFSSPTAIGGSSQVTIAMSNGNIFSTGGSERESNTQIQFNAPRSFSTQNRTIVPSDYITLIQDQFPFIETMIAYGGEDALPPQYGSIIISAIPQGGSVLNDKQKAAVISFLKNKMPLGLTPNIQDADEYNVTIISEVTYNLNTTTLSPAQIETEVATAINSYNTVSLANFGSDLRFSKLTAQIDNADPSIISNETKLQITKKLQPALNFGPQNFSFSFGNPILGYTETPKFSYPLGFTSAISSSVFEYQSGGTTYNASIQDNGLGNLYVFTTNSNGAISVLNPNVGTINYTTGDVSLNSLNVYNYINGEDSLNILASLDGSDIIMQQNKILQIDPIDVSVNVNGIRI